LSKHGAYENEHYQQRLKNHKGWFDCYKKEVNLSS
jgi:hypothetical protein